MKKLVFDQMGRKVDFDFPPKRIISLVPSQTELLVDLGLEKEVVGITKFCAHPKEKWKSTPKVGGTKKFHVDKIVALQPDLIIGNKEENGREHIEQLAELFPVWMSDVKTAEDALDMMVMVGEITGKETKATALVIRIYGAFSKLKSIQNGQPKPKAAFFIWQNPYMVAAKDTFINSMLELAGFENIFPDKTRYPTITLAEVAARRPDVILLSSEPFPFSEKHFPAFQKECQESAVLLVDGEYFSWYGSRMLAAAGYFANLQNIVLENLRV